MVCFLIVSSFATTYTTINISNNPDFYDVSFQINASGQVVWSGQSLDLYTVLLYDPISGVREIHKTLILYFFIKMADKSFVIFLSSLRGAI